MPDGIGVQRTETTVIVNSHYRLTSLYAGIALFSVPGLDSLSAAPALPDDVRIEIEKRINNQLSIGIVVGLIDTNGTSFYSFGRSSLDGNDPINEDSVFQIASVTKLFTGDLMADSISRGEVSETDPLEKYLPPGITVPSWGGRSMTLLDLATHTAGLPTTPDNFVTEDTANPYADFDTQALYAGINGTELSRKPGTEHEYSNFGFGLLGHALANRIGTTYAALLEKRLLSPLGLTNTSTQLSPSMAARLVKGYSGVVDSLPWELPVASFGGLYSTPRDLARFVEANAGILSTPLYPAMTNAQALRFSDDQGNRIGLAWFHFAVGSTDLVWHNGQVGGFTSFAGINPDKKRGVIILSNSEYGITRLGFHLLASDFPLDEAPIPATVTAETLKGYIGRFALDGDAFEIGLHRGHLAATLESLGATVVTLYPASDNTFFINELPFFLQFKVNAHSRAESVNFITDVGTNTYVRVPEALRTLRLRTRHAHRELRVNPPVGSPQILEVSTDLKQWLPIQTNVVWTLPFVDSPDTNATRRFYRTSSVLDN